MTANFFFLLQRQLRCGFFVDGSRLCPCHGKVICAKFPNQLVFFSIFILDLVE
ncbi:hypothetical protein [Myxosarcina sp. GI1(2024)]